ncbi:hypothetical protein [Picrophilus oshimae]|uniref:Uncharacterized protein n=1 Tax=Picrophilus torridus (strain ATCC 700027 / DSM 9790 / JCM 10055 / NBRC 100828 / KAW 2/3) TaxID=1122961 RepID=Q6KZY2_PICTO|nr:hypothetical protein [Picrophilus oshimae]AAT43720.1 hypothetical protein PTO1135 [Picrophilus oshimae DSM 9789]
MKASHLVYGIAIFQLVVLDPLMWYFTQVRPYQYESLWAVTLGLNILMFGIIALIMFRKTLREV